MCHVRSSAFNHTFVVNFNHFSRIDANMQAQKLHVRLQNIDPVSVTDLPSSTKVRAKNVFTPEIQVKK